MKFMNWMEKPYKININSLQFLKTYIRNIKDYKKRFVSEMFKHELKKNQIVMENQELAMIWWEINQEREGEGYEMGIKWMT